MKIPASVRKWYQQFCKEGEHPRPALLHAIHRSFENGYISEKKATELETEFRRWSWYEPESYHCHGCGKLTPQKWDGKGFACQKCHFVNAAPNITNIGKNEILTCAICGENY